MKKTARFVIWICSKFTRQEIEEIIQGLLDVLANRNPEVKPKDDFQEKHPHYRSFFVRRVYGLFFIFYHIGFDTVKISKICSDAT